MTPTLQSWGQHTVWFTVLFQQLKAEVLTVHSEMMLTIDFDMAVEQKLFL